LVYIVIIEGIAINVAIAKQKSFTKSMCFFAWRWRF